MAEGSLDAIQTLLIALVLWLAGVGLGMSVSLGGILAALRRPALVGRTIVLDVVLVPLVMLVAVTVLLPAGDLATGLLLVAFASAGPLGIKLAASAGGDVAYAIGIVIVLELVNVAAIPVWSSLLDVAGGTSAIVDMVRTLLLLIVLPIGVGMLLSSRRATAAARWGPTLDRVSNVGVVVVVGFIIARNIDVLLDSFGSGALAAAAIAIGFALAAGYVLGGPARSTRISTGLVTGVRANAAAVAIASTTFVDAPEVAVGVVIASAVSVLLPSLLAVGLAVGGRRVPAGAT